MAEVEERPRKNVEEFRAALDAPMSPTREAPEGDRIAELERIWHEFRADNDSVVSDYVPAMLREAGEDEMAEAIGGS